MRDVVFPLFELLSTLVKLARPGGNCTVIAQNLLLKQQLVIIKPSTLLHFHNALKKRKYRLLYSPRGGSKPGSKGPFQEVIPDKAGQALNAILEMKQRKRMSANRSADQPGFRSWPGQGHRPARTGCSLRTRYQHARASLAD